MSSVVISVEGLSKEYRLGQIGTGTLAYDLNVWWAKVRGKPNPLRRIGEADHGNREGETIWALKNLNFTVEQGETLGIIGRNGAGKSTLLKILSRVTAPTRGRVKVKGRIASLLEVGTGFHPDLTGRENTYLNGAILGMTRKEVTRKMDEIVAFAEIEQFLDTPVKRYSSGMYVRLAFAVAAHLDPEILVVDEVLAVGDAAFQKKCLGKMGDVAKEGRTVLFVSHNMGSVQQLCQNGILLNLGSIEIIGEMRSVVAKYLSEGTDENDGYVNLATRGDRSGNRDALFKSVELLGVSGRQNMFQFGSPLTLRIMLEVFRYLGSPPLIIVITTSDGIPVHDLMSWNENCKWNADVGKHKFLITIPKINLYPGSYKIDLWLGDQGMRRVDYILNAISFHVVQTPESGIERPLDRSNGLVFQPSSWQYSKD